MADTAANNASSPAAENSHTPPDKENIASRIESSNNNIQPGSVVSEVQQQQNPQPVSSTGDEEKNNDNKLNTMANNKTAEPATTEQDPTPSTTTTATAAATTPAPTSTPTPTSGPAAALSEATRGAAAAAVRRKPVPAGTGAGAGAVSEKPTTTTTTTTKPRSTTDTSTTDTLGNDDSSSCALPPPDFQGEVQTNNELPSPETLRKIETYTVLDADGKSHTFKSLYAGHNVARRVMILFVRHFFCGNCQEYLRTLSAAVTPDALLQLPVSTFIAVVGCGAPELIGPYVRETGCPFPVYTDPTRKLYAELGMLQTLKLGAKPAYLRDTSFGKLVASSVVQGLRQVRSGLATKMGDQRQVGGEFLFEPASLSLEPPIATPVDEKMEAEALLGGEGGGGEGEGVGGQQQQQQQQQQNKKQVEEKRITWCHRMKTTRDHAEIPELMEVLGLEEEDGTAVPIRRSRVDKKKEQRWSKVLGARKGTGLSMASEMSRMSLEATGRVSSFSDKSGRSSIAKTRGREEPAAAAAAATIRSVSSPDAVVTATTTTTTTTTTNNTNGAALNGKKTAV